MINKYNEFINEKLSGKLSGFNADELKQQFLNGKLNVEQYIQKCIEYNLEKPTDDEIKTAISNFNPNEMLFAAVYYNYYDLVKKSFEKGAVITKPSIILLNALYDNNYDIIKCLLEHNIKINKNDIHHARNIEIYNLLKKYYDKQNDKEV